LNVTMADLSLFDHFIKMGPALEDGPQPMTTETTFEAFYVV